ncbi:MAG: GNAT family N-acetyltransferase [Chloroflexi bacterium]|nr:GNAT family N-acetyltransferase [Chloroflexota bacterium]
MKLRKAVLRDLKPIGALIRGYEFTSAGSGQLLEVPRAELERAIRDGRFFVADEEGVIAGCVQLAEYDGIAELRTLAVSGDHQGKGIGSALIGQCKAAALVRGYRVLYSLTQAQNFALFERNGFQKTDKPSEKLMKDCAVCPIKQMCNETAFVVTL